MYLRRVVIALLTLSAGWSTYALTEPSSQNEELKEAVSRMHANGMTKYQSYEEFRSFDVLTRQEAAKFFSEFAINVLYKDIDQNKFCWFDDLEDADPSLKNHIISSCLLGLFQGTAWYFKPYEQFTKAQAIAVLVRSLEWYSNEDTLPRWINYFWKAQSLWLTNETDPYALDRPLLRYEMALLLYRAWNAWQGPYEQIVVDTPTSEHSAWEEETVKVDELIKTGWWE